MSEHPSVNLTVSGGETDPFIEVTINAALHQAFLVNAAAAAVDAALRAVDHPAHHDPVAQCGRTVLHFSHDTTGGRCPGLDGTETEAVEEPDEVMTLREDVERLRAGLEVIAAPDCQNARGDNGCSDQGRTADCLYATARMCGPCIARRVLDGQLLPVEADRD